jgi:hypothetical protein
MGAETHEMLDARGPIPRRLFIQGCAAAGMLVAAPAAWARSAKRQALTRSRFSSLVGETIRMTGGGDDIAVTLTQVGDLLPVLHRNDPNRFSLLFTVSRSHTPSPGIRTFRHQRLGSVELFVSPVGRGIKAHHYEAVINRSRS